jgi:hypothetical protein
MIDSVLIGWYLKGAPNVIWYASAHFPETELSHIALGDCARVYVLADSSRPVAGRVALTWRIARPKRTKPWPRPSSVASRRRAKNATPTKTYSPPWA